MADAFAARYAGRAREVLVARGSHPLPDAASLEAGRRALQLADAARAHGEGLIVLLSGGASAMLEAPAEGISLAETTAVTRLLLGSGLAIDGMNAVRKHLSAIKGGRLGARAGRSLTYALSDVHGPVEDDPAVIGSGPTVADPTTFADAQAALLGANLLESVPSAVRERLARGARGELEETIKPGDPRLSDARFVLAGSRRDAMDGAREAAARIGYAVECLGPPTVGDVADAAHLFLDRVRALAGASPRPLCVIAAGETTVTLSPSASGRGGRNQAFALAAAAGLRDLGACALASIGTDGIDGPTDAAGAIVDATTLSRARALGLDAEAAQRAHDAYPFFRALGDLVVTGPTGTNVGDLQVLLMAEPSSRSPQRW